MSGRARKPRGIVRSPMNARTAPAPAEPRTSALSDIVIRGAREHNLQDISLRLPRQSLVVITGVSGSG